MNLTYVALPVSYAPGAGKVVEMLVAAGFTFLFLRRLRLGRPAAVLGGMIYMATGFQVAWSNWPQPQVGALIPALFWAVERHLQDRTRRTFVAPAIAFGLMLASNFPAIVGFTLALLGPYVLLRTWVLDDGDWRGMVRRLGGLAIAFGLGATLAAVVVVPLREFLSAYDVLEDRAQGPDSHLGLHWLSTLVAPFALGNPSDGVAWAGNIIEGLSFLGGAAAVLAGLSLLLRPVASVPRGVRALFGVAAGSSPS